MMVEPKGQRAETESWPRRIKVELKGHGSHAVAVNTKTTDGWRVWWARSKISLVWSSRDQSPCLRRRIASWQIPLDIWHCVSPQQAFLKERRQELVEESLQNKDIQDRFIAQWAKAIACVTYRTSWFAELDVFLGSYILEPGTTF